MHEIGIAKGILKKALEIAEANKGRKVTKINVKAGQGEMLTQETLQQAFTMLAEKTVVRNAVIDLEEFAGTGITIKTIEVE